jgi:hypothetical protein
MTTPGKNPSVTSDPAKTPMTQSTIDEAATALERDAVVCTDTRDEVLFELEIERHALGSHVGGAHGVVVRCPRCARSACQIGRRRYAPALRLFRCLSWTRGAGGKQVQVRDVRAKWRRICTAPAPSANVAPESP